MDGAEVVGASHRPKVTVEQFGVAIRRAD